MKRFTFIITLVALLVAGCNSSNQKNNTGGEISTAPSPAEQVVEVKPISTSTVDGKLVVTINHDGTQLLIRDIDVFWKPFDGGYPRVAANGLGNPQVYYTVENPTNTDFTYVPKIQITYIDKADNKVWHSSNRYSLINNPIPPGAAEDYALNDDREQVALGWFPLRYRAYIDGEFAWEGDVRLTLSK